ncbi:glycosyltransferase family 87 protein [Mucilaginibacter ximonensis]|uniref:Glycosyltransferase family 87 protein n=1 Tax=Mucilaginibacter ximonensis TaxID=538021 RepID=A0ABW5Y7N6_9SPHI
MSNRRFIYLSGYQWLWVLYIAVAIYTSIFKYSRGIDNNYKIFRASYSHAIQEKDLYASYPQEYGDLYYYGPVFPLIIAPSALLPHFWGFLLWELANAMAILLAINLLPFTVRQKSQLLLLCAIEYANSVFYMQFNPAITAMIVLSFIFVERGKEQWATLFVVLGFLIKLYPVIGLTFFLFSRNKGRFVLWTVIWGIVLFIAPLILYSPGYMINSYHQWLAAVHSKVGLNAYFDSPQDICVMGVVRRLTHNINIPNGPFLIVGALLFLAPLLRISQYKSFKYRAQVLASALILVVIFSTGAEHPTYIIAVTGVFIWMLIQDKPYTAFNIVLLVLVLVITGLGLTDAVPKLIREPYIAKYSVKAWPVIMVWVKIAYELLFNNFVAENSRIDQQYERLKNKDWLVSIS